MKLNGWQRLWVVAGGIYFISAAAYVVARFPRPADVPHSEELYRQLKPESFRSIAILSTGHFTPDAPGLSLDARKPASGFDPSTAVPASSDDGWRDLTPGKTPEQAPAWATQPSEEAPKTKAAGTSDGREDVAPVQPNATEAGHGPWEDYQPKATASNETPSKTATFEFTSPEGTKYQVEGPAGSTAEQAFVILRRKLASKWITGTWSMDVRLPNGTTVRDVPVGTTKEQLAKKLKASGLVVPDGWTGTLPADAEERQRLARDVDSFDPSTARPVLTPDEVVEVVAPNGQRIPFPKYLSPDERQSVVSEYSNILSATANRERVRLILRVFTIWLFSCLLVYVFGWSVGWVYRGFRRAT